MARRSKLKKDEIIEMFTRFRNVEPEPKGDTMSLEQVLGLVKAHTAQTGACCVAKLYAPTIKDALEMLRAITETS